MRVSNSENCTETQFKKQLWRSHSATELMVKRQAHDAALLAPSSGNTTLFVLRYPLPRLCALLLLPFPLGGSDERPCGKGLVGYGKRLNCVFTSLIWMCPGNCYFHHSWLTQSLVEALSFFRKTQTTALPSGRMTKFPLPSSPTLLR